VIQYAKEHGNKATKRHCGHPPTLKMIREWRKQKAGLQQLGKKNIPFICILQNGLSQNEL
jgi:hypothetical protein